MFSIGTNSSKTIKRTQNMLIETDIEMHRFDRNIKKIAKFLFREGQPVNRDYYAAILARLSETVRKKQAALGRTIRSSIKTAPQHPVQQFMATDLWLDWTSLLFARFFFRWLLDLPRIKVHAEKKECFKTLKAFINLRRQRWRLLRKSSSNNIPSSGSITRRYAEVDPSN